MSSPYVRTKDSFNAEFFLQPIDQHYESKTPNRYHSDNLSFFGLADRRNVLRQGKEDKPWKNKVSQNKEKEGKISLTDFLKENVFHSDEEDTSLGTDSNASPFLHFKCDSVKSINDFLKVPLNKPKHANSKFHKQSPIVFSDKLTKGWTEKINFMKYSEYIKLQVLTDERYQQKPVCELEKEIKWITEN